MESDQEKIDQISRTLAAGKSRRGIPRALAVGAAGSLLAAVGQTATAGERPHQRLQSRSKQRNRKQRNTRNANQVKDQDNNGDNSGGSVCRAGCQEQFEGCMEPCGGNPGSLAFCETRCNDQLSTCEGRC